MQPILTAFDTLCIFSQTIHYEENVACVSAGEAIGEYLECIGEWEIGLCTLSFLPLMLFSYVQSTFYVQN